MGTESLTNLQVLRSIWRQEKVTFGFSNDEYEAIAELVTEVFNPSKTRTSLLKALSKMPDKSIFSLNSISYLERNRFAISLSFAQQEKISVTPEGLIHLFASDKPICTQKYNEAAYNAYRDQCYHQLKRLESKKNLKPKHIATILFFLLNQSIGERRAYNVESVEDIRCIDRIVQAYISSPESDTTECDTNEGYALRYYLVEAKAILGDVIYNDKPRYYLKSEDIEYIITSIKSAVDKDNRFSYRWKQLTAAYNANLTYLRSRKNSNYSSSWQLEIEQRLLPPHSRLSGDN